LKLIRNTTLFGVGELRSCNEQSLAAVCQIDESAYMVRLTLKYHVTNAMQHWVIRIARRLPVWKLAQHGTQSCLIADGEELLPSYCG